jgi:putative spermidine/putrescine transport system ATP-binding protein
MNVAATPDDNAPAVELNGIAKAFHSVVALDEIGLSIPSGALVAILGPSGSGKSTLLGVIAGHIPQDRGAVRLFGQSIPRSLPAERRGLGMVFQQPTLFPHYTVWDNIAFPLRARHADAATLRTRVTAIVRLVGIEGLEGRLPHTLSGGQQQRVALARALVFSPRLVLLDEPLSALDRPTREWLQEEIRRLQRRTLATFVHVTHDRDEALAIASLIVIMRSGRVVQAGHPEELYWRPQSAFVAEFFGGCNIARGGARRVGDRIEAVGEGGVVLSRGAAPAASDTSGDIAVVLWPERLTITAVQCPHDIRSSVRARIVDRRFLGHTSVLTLDTPIGLMKARVDVKDDEAGPAATDTVRLSWDPEQTRMLPADAPPKQARR